MEEQVFQALFESGPIGTMRLKNRLIMPPSSTNLAAQGRTVSDALIFHYAERATDYRLYFTAPLASLAYPLVCHGAAQPRIDDDAFIPGLRRLADAIHRGGAKATVELTHPEMNTDLRYIEGETPDWVSPVSFQSRIARHALRSNDPPQPSYIHLP